MAASTATAKRMRDVATILKAAPLIAEYRQLCWAQLANEQTTSVRWLVDNLKNDVETLETIRSLAIRRHAALIEETHQKLAELGVAISDEDVPPPPPSYFEFCPRKQR